MEIAVLALASSGTALATGVGTLPVSRLGAHATTIRRSVLVFGVLLLHSLPEGFAIGTAFASETEGLGLFVILAIALQNVPEGTSVAIPMEAAGFQPRQQFWAAVLTSAPQPVVSLAGTAAGAAAMLALAAVLGV